MTGKVLNWGLLSTARINRALIPAIQSSGRNRLQAVASRSLERAEAYARQWRIPQAVAGYEALLDDPQIDVIYNSLPNHLHAEWSIRALRAGKHVLCEKPLALTVEDVDAMADAARESGRVLAEAFMYRHHPQTLRVQELVAGGRLGRLQLLQGAFAFSLSREGDIRWKKDTGGGSIWDVGCYPISYMRMLTGTEPQQVFGWQKLGEGGADVTFVGQMRFPGDVQAQFYSSLVSPFRAYMTIVGSEAILEVPVPFKPGRRERLVLRRGDHTETIDVRGSELYAGEVEDMADAVLLGKAPRLSLADSRVTVAAIAALLRSAERGEPVALP